MSFRFSAAEKARYPVRMLCRLLAGSPSGFYAWAARPGAARPARDLALRHAIRVAHAESRGRYGSPRILHTVQARGHRVGRHRVMRLMRAEGLRARRPRRFPVTTDSGHAWAPVPNRLRRPLRAPAANQRWVADLTYLETTEGWLYLAVILDLDSRRVVGWAVRPTLHRERAIAALDMALSRRHPPRGLRHHSDRGIQYASADYQAILAAHHVIPSMSRRGNCWDNAVADSFFSTRKQELPPARWATRAEAHRDVATYIETLYNPVRLHSTLGYQAPAAFEAARVM